MKLAKMIKEYLGLMPSETIPVYCQYCWKELTNIGGEITTTGRIYCSEKTTSPPCLLAAACDRNDGFGEITYFQFGISGIRLTGDMVSKKGLQKAIRNSKLTRFGPQNKAAYPIPQPRPSVL